MHAPKITLTKSALFKNEEILKLLTKGKVTIVHFFGTMNLSPRSLFAKMIFCVLNLKKRS